MNTNIFLVEADEGIFNAITDLITTQGLGKIALMAYGRKQALSLIPDQLKSAKVNLSILGEDSDWQSPMGDVAIAIKVAFPHMPVIGHAFYNIPNVDTFIKLTETPQLLITAIHGFAQKGLKV